MNEDARPGLPSESAQEFNMGQYTSFHRTGHPLTNGYNTALTVQTADSNLLALTEYGNAERLVQRYSDRIRYCAELGHWFVWNGKHWQSDTTNEVERLAKQVVRDIYGEAQQCNDDRIRSEIAAHAKRSESAAWLKNMVRLAQTEAPVVMRASDFDNADRVKWLLNVENGTLELSHQELREHDRSDLLTYVTSYSYEPGAKCPSWMQFLHRVQPDPEIQSFLQRAVGYSLTGDTCEQVLFFLYGDGANGKSKFISALELLLRPLWHKARAETFMAATQSRNRGAASPELAAFKSKRLITVSEVEQGRRLDEALIKDVTGEDIITARPLYGDEFTFRPQFKTWMYGNHKPIVRGNDNGIWRRLLLIPFEVQIPEPEQDKMLLDRFKGELPGILNWALHGLESWQDNGLRIPTSVQMATSDYRSEMDTVTQFIKARCDVSSDKKCPARGLFTAYKQFCDNSGLRGCDEKQFAAELEKRGHTAHKQSQGIFRLGIRLSN